MVAPLIDALLSRSDKALPPEAVIVPPLTLTVEPLLAMMALVAPPGMIFKVAPLLTTQPSTCEPAFTSSELPGPLTLPATATEACDKVINAIAVTSGLTAWGAMSRQCLDVMLG
ncbi:hypothetical protein BGV68_03630 [Burkholderia ubonensis]|nr:hypothetical protein BGV68_03630 [Burkholderia ubonensis]